MMTKAIQLFLVSRCCVVVEVQELGQSFKSSMQRLPVEVDIFTGNLHKKFHYGSAGSIKTIPVKDPV